MWSKYKKGKKVGGHPSTKHQKRFYLPGACALKNRKEEIYNDKVFFKN